MSPTRPLTLISVDDHLVEPPHLFEGRVPARFADRAPFVKTTSKGNQIWVFDGEAYPQVGLNAVAGRSKDAPPMEPVRFDEMRPGCFDPDARVADMDIGGIWASANFPSANLGLLRSGVLEVLRRGTRPRLRPSLQRLVLRGVVHAPIRTASSRWGSRSWPIRSWPRPRSAATRNAGSRAVSLPEQPQKLGYPSLHSGWWDPVVQACVDTGTVVCLHVGSSGIATDDLPLDGPLVEFTATLFSSLSMHAAPTGCGRAFRCATRPEDLPERGRDRLGADAGRPPRLHPRRLRSRSPGLAVDRRDADRGAAANFWFCSLDDPSIWPIRDRIGVDHIMVEVDYPHADSTWPDTQDFLADRLADLSDDEAAAVTHRNAAALFRHPLPLHRPRAHRCSLTALSTDHEDITP